MPNVFNSYQTSGCPFISAVIYPVHASIVLPRPCFSPLKFIDPLWKRGVQKRGTLNSVHRKAICITVMPLAGYGLK